VITGAPIIFLTIVCVLGAIMYVGMGKYYAHSLSAKDSIISILRERLENGESTRSLRSSTTQPIALGSKTSESVAPTDLSKIEPAATPFPAPLPNIVAVRAEIQWLPKRIEVDENGGQRLRRCQAFIAIFHNLPLPDRDIGSAENVTAYIVYDSKGLEFAEVTKGIWMGDNGEWRSNKVDFKPNSIRRLILAREGDKGDFFALEDYSDSGTANVLSNAGYGSRVSLDIPTGFRCRATVQFTINGRADQQKYHFNLGFGGSPYCGREEDEVF
jgi:hypothetical protein